MCIRDSPCTTWTAESLQNYNWHYYHFVSMAKEFKFRRGKEHITFKKLGPILDWNIDLSGKKIKVNTENYQTSKEGIFAVGDINDYPGKLDLILSGFHETTLAVQEAYKRIYPGERVPFGYTTSNSKLQEKLGVKK